MTCIAAKNIMHPRVSIYAKTNGEQLIERLMSSYPALPVVDDDLRVMGVVSEYDVLTALKEGRTIYEFSAESLMTCGHAEHGSCESPVTVQQNTEIEDIVELRRVSGKSMSLRKEVSLQKSSISIVMICC